MSDRTREKGLEKSLEKSLGKNANKSPKHEGTQSPRAGVVSALGSFHPVRLADELLDFPGAVR